MFGKFFVFALTASACLAAATDSMKYTVKTGDMDMLMKQKRIFGLLMYINQDLLTDTEYFEMGRNYDIVSNIDRYNNREVVMNFLIRFRLGMLRKDALFTYYKQEHREEMVLLYKLFYTAKDFTTFYKTACWARIHMNPGMFVTAFTTAVIYREDCRLLRLPAINEINPNVFFDSKIIREAYRVAMTRGPMSDVTRTMMHSDVSDSVETYHLYTNFTEKTVKPTIMREDQLAYFTDDIGLNSYYYYVRMMFPFWVNTQEFDVPKNLRGDLYYFIHQQIMARYMLERRSNRLDEITDCSWDDMCIPEFQSNLVYANGVAMPRRDWWNVVPYYKQKYVEYLKKLEIRIMEAIDSGFVIDEMGKQVSLRTPEGLNILGNIIEGNYDSINLKYYGSYETLARLALGMNIDNKNKNLYVPSALELFGTTMKDPAFYRINKKIVDMVLRCKSHLDRYTKNELEFNGVRIENVEIDKLVTFWDTRDYFINNIIDANSMKDGKSFKIKAWQYNLNYKPFTYKITVNSDKTTKAVMRIFLGPADETEKYDQYTYLLNNYKYFFMLDEFEVNLREGMNNIDRNSGETILFKREMMTGDKFYRKIIQSIEGKEPMTFKDRIWGFPDNLMLPKGSADGMRFKLFVYIGQYDAGKVMDLPVLGKRMFYGKSLGFPLDRPMRPVMLQLDNVFLRDVVIYNLEDNEMMGGRADSMTNTMMRMKDRDLMMRLRDTDMRGADTFRMKDMDSMSDLNMMHI